MSNEEAGRNGETAGVRTGNIAQLVRVGIKTEEVLAQERRQLAQALYDYFHNLGFVCPQGKKDINANIHITKDCQLVFSSLGLAKIINGMRVFYTPYFSEVSEWEKALPFGEIVNEKRLRMVSAEELLYRLNLQIYR